VAYIQLENILGVPIEIFVRNQIRNRSSRISSTNSNWNEDDTIKYKANRTGWVRLVSGVDVNEENLMKTYGLSDPSDLAKSFVLMGGTSKYKTRTVKPYKYDPDSSEEYNLKWQAEAPEITEFDGYSLRSGFQDTYNLFGADELNSFGYRPMPGIKSVKITTAGKLGSIKTANISFTVNSKSQLDVIDILYFKLGYMMFLEWGNTMYVDTKGVVKSSEEYSIDPFEVGMDKDRLRAKILKSIKESDGNYDAMIGIVTNFNFSFKDGSYSCELSLMGLGVLAESMRMNNTATQYPELLRNTIKDLVNLRNAEIEETKRKAREKALKQLNAQFAVEGTPIKASQLAQPENASKFGFTVLYTFNNSNENRLLAKDYYFKDAGGNDFLIINQFQTGDDSKAISGKAQMRLNTITNTYEYSDAAENYKVQISSDKIDKVFKIYDSSYNAADIKAVAAESLDYTNIEISVKEGGLQFPIWYGKDNPNYSAIPKKYDGSSARIKNDYTEKFEFFAAGNGDKWWYYHYLTKANIRFTLGSIDIKVSNFPIRLTETSEGIVEAGINRRVRFEEGKLYDFTSDFNKLRDLMLIIFSRVKYTESTKFGFEISRGSASDIIQYSCQFSVNISDFQDILNTGIEGPIYTNSSLNSPEDNSPLYRRDKAPEAYGQIKLEIQNLLLNETFNFSITASTTDSAFLQNLNIVNGITLSPSKKIRIFSDAGTFTTDSDAARQAEEEAIDELGDKGKKLDANEVQSYEASRYSSYLQLMLRGVQLYSYAKVSKKGQRSTLKQTANLAEYITNFINPSPTQGNKSSSEDKNFIDNLFENGALKVLKNENYNIGKFVNDTLPEKIDFENNRYYTELSYGFARMIMRSEDPLLLITKGKPKEEDATNTNNENKKTEQSEENKETKFIQGPVKFEDLMVSYVVPYNQVSQDASATAELNYPCYIPLGFLFMMFNHVSLLYENDSKKGEKDKNRPLVYIDFNPDSNLCLRSGQTLTIDPYKFLVPYHGTSEQFQQLFDDNVKKDAKTLKSPKDTSARIKGAENIWDPSKQDGISKYLPSFITDDAGYGVYKGKLMNVLVNVSYVLSMIENKIQADESNSLLLKPTLEDLVIDLNRCLGSFNYLRVGYDQEANVFYITDDQSVPSVNMVDRQKSNGGKYDLPLYGKNSIAESFDFKTEYGTKLANLLAIAANSDTGGEEGSSTAGKEVSTIAKANKGLVNRYAPVIGAVNEPKPKENKDQKDAAESTSKSQEPNDTTKLAALQFNNAIKSFYSELNNSSQDKVNLCTNYYLDRLTKTKTKDPSTNSSAMIPLTLNFTTDGISGLYMGNAFTVSEDILPYSFNRTIKSTDANGDGEVTTRTLGFIITGLDHSIENNRWKTSVKANMYYLKSLTDYSAETRNLSQDTGGITVDQKALAEAKKAQIPEGETPMSTDNFGIGKKYHSNYEFKRGTSNIDLSKMGLSALSDSEINDVTNENRFNFGTIPSPVQYFVVHHTAGCQACGYQGTVKTFYDRGLPVQYIIDRDGSIYRFLPDGAKGQHTYPGKVNGKTISNSNSIGAELVSALDNADASITDAQVNSAIKLIHWLGISKENVFGHGEVQTTENLRAGGFDTSFTKEPNEGGKVCTKIRTQG